MRTHRHVKLKIADVRSVVVQQIAARHHRETTTLQDLVKIVDTGMTITVAAHVKLNPRIRTDAMVSVEEVEDTAVVVGTATMVD